MQRRPTGVSIIAVMYLIGGAGYTALLLFWLVGRNSLISFVETATPSALLGPAVLLDVPGVVTAYFGVMAGFCCWVGIALWKLQRWSWFVTCAFAIFSFVFDVSLFVHMFRHLPIALLFLGLLRFAFLVGIVLYFGKTGVRAAFGLTRAKAAA